MVKFDRLHEYISTQDSKVRVINFWATWCKPCVEELPFFEAANSKYAGQGVEIVLVSFDFPRQLESKIKPFLTKHNVQSRVMVLDETDFDVFIDQIDPAWSGAIPATLFVDGQNGKKELFEKQFKPGELEKVIQQYIH